RGKPGSRLGSWWTAIERRSSPVPHGWLALALSVTCRRRLTVYCSVVSSVLVTDIRYGFCASSQNVAGMPLRLSVPETFFGPVPLPEANVVQASRSEERRVGKDVRR